MNKIIPGIIFLLLITSCGFEMPESITVKGNPGLYVPLGSPFAGMDPDERLEQLIRKDNIKKMMNNADSDAREMEVYEVSPQMAINHNIDPDLLTYLVDYQLADMPLNLQTYMDKAIDALKSKREISIPAIPSKYAGVDLSNHPLYFKNEDGDLTDNINEEGPFLKIPLNDMGKLVKEVTRNEDGKFGLKIPEINKNPDLKKYLWLKIPALGIDDYIEGEPEDGELFFVDRSGSPFYPRENLQKSGSNYELWVYAKITGACEGTIDPEIVFEWESAQIDTGEADASSFKEEYNIGNSLGNFLGEGTSFKEVSGYVYMTGIEDNGPFEMNVYIDGSDTQIRYLKNAAPSFTVGDDGLAYGNLTNSSFTDKPDGTSHIKEPLDLAPIFTKDGGKINVDIIIEDWWIYYNPEDIYDTSIHCRLLVLIPLDLKITGECIQPTREEGNPDDKEYVMLELEALKKGLGKGDDLFNRKPGEDNALKDIKYVDINLMFSKNDINIIDSGRLAILVTKTTNDGKISRLLEFKNNNKLRLSGSFLNDIPFNPTFSVLLERDKFQDFGSFQILRQNNPKFDFKIYIQAKAKLEYTLDFEE